MVGASCTEQMSVCDVSLSETFWGQGSRHNPKSAGKGAECEVLSAW